MFAILKTGGKQYKVAKEEKLLIEKIDGNIGDEVVFNDIIMINDNGKTEIGSPLVKDAAVVAEVIKQTRGPKITIIYNICLRVIIYYISLLLVVKFLIKV